MTAQPTEKDYLDAFEAWFGTPFKGLFDLWFFRRHAGIQRIALALALANARQSALEEAETAIQNERTKDAGNFTAAKCRGQRGQDRADAFYDAIVVVRHLRTPPDRATS
jgi:hypothetical protein